MTRKTKLEKCKKCVRRWSPHYGHVTLQCADCAIEEVGDENMNNRKNKLEKALAFEGTKLPFKHFPIILTDEGEQFALINEYTKHGMKLASLAPLHAALLEAVETLEVIGDFPCSQMWFQDEAREALAKLDKVLEEE